MFILPFQFLLDGRRGTLISGSVILSSGLTTITGMLSDLDDGVIIKFDLSISEDLISTTLSGHVVIEIEDLGEATIYFNIIDSILGTSIEVTVDANFEPEDLIEWICCEPEDTDLRDQLLQYLPFLQMVFRFGFETWFLAGEFDDDQDDMEEDDDEDWDLDAFADFETDDLPLNTMGLDRPYTGRRSSWLDVMDLDGYRSPEPRVPTLDEASHMAGVWRDLEVRLTGTELVHVPGFGHSGRVEVIRHHLGVDQIVEQALRL